MRYGYIIIANEEVKGFKKEEYIEKWGLDEIYWDLRIGRNKMKPQYYFMDKRLEKGDTVVIDRIANLGMTTEELERMINGAKERGISILSYNDDTILTNKDTIKIIKGISEGNKERQKRFVAKAKERGVEFGRKKEYGTDEKELAKAMLGYHTQKLSWKEAAEKLGMKKTTFFYRYNKWKEETGL